MRALLLAALFVVFALPVVGGPTIALAQAGCGLQPMAPMPPMGCRAMVPVCVCNNVGQGCHWVFQCVR